MSGVMPNARERRVLALAMPPWRQLWPAVAFGTLSALCAVALLATSALLITRASLTIHILLLGIPIVLVRAFALFRAVFRYVDRLVGHDAAFRQLTGLRVGLFDRLLPLAPAGLGTTKRGDLLTRLVDDVDELQFLPLRVVEPLIISASTALVTVIGVSVIMPAAGLVLAITLIAGFAVATLAQFAISGRADREVSPLRANLNDRIHDTVRNLDVLQAYDALDGALEQVHAADGRLRRALVRRAVGEGVSAGALSLCAGLAVAGALAVGINPVADGALLPEYLTLAALVPLALFDVFGALPQAVASWRRVRVSARRVAQAAPEWLPAEIPRDGGGTGAQVPEGAVEVVLRGLAVRWPGAERPAIEQLDVTLQPGSRLLVTGESGAGKTTLANALVRFLDYRGSFRIGGIEARDIDPREVRRCIGLVEQRPHLFDTSIRQNLLFANDSASDEMLEAVLERVGLREWMRERGGLDALVGERGTLISGGQAQRLALARGLLADFRILVLDEPTANVDPARAETLVRDLLTAAGERSVVLISHTPVDAQLVTAHLHLTSPAG